MGGGNGVKKHPVGLCANQPTARVGNREFAASAEDGSEYVVSGDEEPRLEGLGCYDACHGGSCQRSVVLQVGRRAAPPEARVAGSARAIVAMEPTAACAGGDIMAVACRDIPRRCMAVYIPQEAQCVHPGDVESDHTCTTPTSAVRAGQRVLLCVRDSLFEV